MAHPIISRQPTGSGACWLISAAAAIVVVSVLLHDQIVGDPTAWGWPSGIVVSAALALAAALANLARSARPGDEIWPVVVLLSALAAHQVVTTTLELMAGHSAEPSTTWAMEVELGVLVVALTLCLLLPMLGFRPPPLALGAALGLTAAAALVAAPFAAPDGSLVTRALLSVALWLGYALVAAVVVHRHWPWNDLTRTWMMLAVLCLGIADAVQALAETWVWAGVAGVGAQLVAAGLLTTSMYTVVRADLMAHRRHIHALRDRLIAEEDHVRRDRFHQHTMRNLAAGITMAAELLEDDDLEESTRRRLEHRIHLEAEQLCGLFEQPSAPAGPVHHDNLSSTPAVPGRQTPVLAAFGASGPAGETHVHQPSQP